MPLSKTGSKAKFRHETVKSKGRFDPRSFRTVMARAHRVTVGCPKSKYDPKRKKCKVPTQVQKILHPLKERKMTAKGKLNPLKQRILNYAELYAAKLYGQGMGVGSVTRAIRKKYKSLSLADARYISGRVARIGRGAVKHRSKKVERLATFPILRKNVSKKKNWKPIKRSKRDLIIDHIIAEVYENGRITKKALEFYIDNRISKKAFDDACRLAMKMRERATKNVKRNVRKKTNPRKKWYFGPSVQHRGKILVFSSARNPSKKTHGKYIKNAVGPYASKVTAMNAAKRCMN